MDRKVQKQAVMSTANLLCDNAGTRWSDSSYSWHSCMTAGLPTEPTISTQTMCADSHHTEINIKKNMQQVPHLQRSNYFHSLAFNISLLYLDQCHICSYISNLHKEAHLHQRPSPLHYLPNQESKRPYRNTFPVSIIVCHVEYEHGNFYFLLCVCESQK